MLNKENNNTMFEKTNLKKGFTLVEVMFAVFILTFTIVGLMTVVSNSLFAARYARDEITANYLLQEVVDYIRNDRDSSVFLKSAEGSSDTLWASFYTKYNLCREGSGSGCILDVSKGEIKSCTETNCYLYYDSSAQNKSFYNYNSNDGKKTKFRRQIIVSQGGSSDEITVYVKVMWKNGNKDKSIDLQTSLLRWQ